MLADPAKRLVAAETEAGLVGLAGLEGAEVILVYTAPDAPPGTGQLLTAVEALARDSSHGALTLIASRNALSFYLHGGYRIWDNRLESLIKGGAGGSAVQDSWIVGPGSLFRVEPVGKGFGHETHGQGQNPFRRVPQIGRAHV